MFFVSFSPLIERGVYILSHCQLCSVYASPRFLVVLFAFAFSFPFYLTGVWFEEYQSGGLSVYDVLKLKSHPVCWILSLARIDSVLYRLAELLHNIHKLLPLDLVARC